MCFKDFTRATPCSKPHAIPASPLPAALYFAYTRTTAMATTSCLSIYAVAAVREPTPAISCPRFSATPRPIRTPHLCDSTLSTSMSTSSSSSGSSNADSSSLTRPLPPPPPRRPLPPPPSLSLSSLSAYDTLATVRWLVRAGCARRRDDAAGAAGAAAGAELWRDREPLLRRPAGPTVPPLGPERGLAARSSNVEACAYEGKSGLASGVCKLSSRIVAAETKSP